MARRLFGVTVTDWRHLVQRGSAAVAASSPILASSVMSVQGRARGADAGHLRVAVVPDGRPPRMVMLLVRSGRPVADIEIMVRSALDEFDRSRPISRVEPMVRPRRCEPGAGAPVREDRGSASHDCVLLAAVGLIHSSIVQRRAAEARDRVSPWRSARSRRDLLVWS